MGKQDDAVEWFEKNKHTISENVDTIKVKQIGPMAYELVFFNKYNVELSFGDRFASMQLSKAMQYAALITAETEAKVVVVCANEGDSEDDKPHRPLPSKNLIDHIFNAATEAGIAGRKEVHTSQLILTLLDAPVFGMIFHVLGGEKFCDRLRNLCELTLVDLDRHEAEEKAEK